MLIFSGQRLSAQSLASLAPEESMKKRAEFVNAALSYKGTPYAYGGSSRRGMDCSGLVCRAGIEGPGISLPRTAASLGNYAHRIDESELEAGDLVFFNTAGRISHVGIYIGNGEFVHSASDGPKRGVIVSKLTEPYWRRTYRFSGRIFPSAESAVAASAPAETAAVASSGSRAGNSASPSPSSAGGNGASSASPSETAAVARQAPGASSAVRAASARASQKRHSPYGLRLELRGTALWDFNIDEKLIRGTTASVTAQWRGRSSFYPGLTAGFTWDTRHDTMSVPLYISVTARNGLAVFAGTQFIFQSQGDASTEIFFPGLVGASWTSPYKDLGAVKIGFYQSIECVFVRKEGVAGRTLPDVFRLSTGVTFAFGK